jgi:hypothetical protein
MARDVFDPSAFAAWFPGSGPLLGVPRARLAIAQSMALAAMAFCYFLAPQFAWAYAIVAVGGFMGLALPAVASVPVGVAGQRLMNASPGRPHLPGGAGYAVRVAVRLFISFAVPAAVAAALPSPVAARSAEPWIAIGGLLGMAAAVVAAARLAGSGRSNLGSFVVVAGAVIILTATLAFSVLPVLRQLPWVGPT